VTLQAVVDPADLAAAAAAVLVLEEKVEEAHTAY
jgi:hypothetical protein